VLLDEFREQAARCLRPGIGPTLLLSLDAVGRHPLVEVASRWERAMQISLSEEDAAILQQVLDAKLTDLRR
jgi:hypothetical protein